MGIYISNLKIPKDGYLPINIYPDGGVACRFDANCANAIEIPPHGRLIDADKLADSFEPSDFWNSDAEDNCFAAVRIVHSASTIIPADDKDINVLGKEEPTHSNASNTLKALREEGET